jgi:hypothetical protein
MLIATRVKRKERWVVTDHRGKIVVQLSASVCHRGAGQLGTIRGTITHYRTPPNTVNDKCLQELFYHVLESHW